MSFITEKLLKEEGITFDDVLIVPGYSKILPRNVDVSTHFTRNIKLNIPIVSSAMDTVTNASLSIAIAREGGIGVIHRNMPIDAQAKEVMKVKRSESWMIANPYTLKEDSNVADAINLMNEHHIGGIPIVNNENKLVGIVTNRDLRFEKATNRSITEVMTKHNLITITEITSLDKAEDILQQHKIEKLPVVDKNFKLIGLITLKDIVKWKTHPDACKDAQGRLRVVAAIGVGKEALERASALIDAEVDALVIDTAHGWTKNVLETLRILKREFLDVEVVAGNIATAEAAKEMVKAGADAVKVGLGPGSICTTRIIAGVGVPQLTAIFDVYNAIKDTGIPIIADGGVRYSGDIVKAIVAGADTIMIGSLLAGVEESPGETIILEGRKFKIYRGMGSIEAMEQGARDRYGQDEEDISKLVPEGIVGRVPYKGKLSEVIFQLVGGIKAGMGYIGAKDINMLKQAKFIKITAAGVRESHPHDVTIIKEAPNYSR